MVTGRPTEQFPYPWSVRRWLPGDAPDSDVAVLDRAGFADDLGRFLHQLRTVPSHDGPAAGLHSFYRGCHPSVYADQVQAALVELADRVDVDACTRVWRDATRSAWSRTPVWFHGDIAVGNLLSEAGRLSAVIDFGTCGVGDPACDLVIAWTFLTAEEQQIFHEAVDLPLDAWARARGWAMWKALITLTEPASPHHETQVRALERLLKDATAA